VKNTYSVPPNSLAGLMRCSREAEGTNEGLGKEAKSRGVFKCEGGKHPLRGVDKTREVRGRRGGKGQRRREEIKDEGRGQDINGRGQGKR